MEKVLQAALVKGVEMHTAGNFDFASQFYDSVIKLQPNHADANHNMGVLKVDTGHALEALPFFSTALQADKSVAQFWLSYIKALIKLNRLVEASRIINLAKKTGIEHDEFVEINQLLDSKSDSERIVETGADTPGQSEPNILDNLKLDQALKLAKLSIKKGASEEAIKLYQEILHKFPKNKTAQKRLAQLIQPTKDNIDKLLEIYNRGHTKTVVKNAKLILKYFPEVFEVWNILGAAHAHMGNLDQAIRSFERVLALKPNYEDAYNNIGNVYKDQGKYDKAIEAFNKALSIKADYAEAYFNLGIALKEQGKLQEAENAYKQAVLFKPTYASAFNNLGIVLKDQGKLHEAIVVFKKGLSFEDNNPEFYYNLANSLQEQGELGKALEAYRTAVFFKPDYFAAHGNIGVCYATLGEIEEAILSYNKALSLESTSLNIANVIYNKGNALLNKGAFEEAENAYNKSLSLHPNNPDAYYNLGNALQSQSKLGPAVQAFTKALNLKPDYAEASNNLGNALKDQNRLEDAIEAYKATLNLKPESVETYFNLGIALSGVQFKQPNTDLQSIILSLLEYKTFVRPKDIAPAIISLLKFEPLINGLLQENHQFRINHLSNETVSDLSNFPLLLKLMSICPLVDLELEALFTKIRSYLLNSVTDNMWMPAFISFQSALALQCFTNEYIYAESVSETKKIDCIEAVIKKSLLNGMQPDLEHVLCLASYRPLNKYEWSDKLTVTADLEEVWTRQIAEPKKEAFIAAKMTNFQSISDKVSSKVRNQYETSPYPRWVNLGLPLKPAKVSAVVDQLNLKLFDYAIAKIEAPEILVAGCGTGQHSISTAARFKNSKTLSIDLSLSSLAYAKRQTDELSVQNIEYLQADILDLGKLNKRFDIIECGGVLHHMENPKLGWQTLTDRLKQGGLMKIGLYSELARRHILKIREEIIKEGVDATEPAMKSFRNDIINSDKDHHKQIQNSPDFYSMSELKDLLFHVQEHRFSLNEIQDCLSDLGLRFCGFESPTIVAAFKSKHSGIGDPYDLTKWQVYEQENPSTFGGMYQFWCQKLIQN